MVEQLPYFFHCSRTYIRNRKDRWFSPEGSIILGTIFCAASVKSQSTSPRGLTVRKTKGNQWFKKVNGHNNIKIIFLFFSCLCDSYLTANIAFTLPTLSTLVFLAHNFDYINSLNTLLHICSPINFQEKYELMWPGTLHAATIHKVTVELTVWKMRKKMSTNIIF